MFPSPRRLLVIAPLMLAAGDASAHSRLVSPASRTTDNYLTAPPCGGAARTDAPAVFAPGATITVEWHVEVLHGGPMRLAFSPASDLEFDENVLADALMEIADVHDYSAEVTLPACTCTDCTIQLIQITGTETDGYHSCADIQLVAPDGYPPCPEPEGDTGGSSGGPDDRDEGHGCRVAGTLPTPLGGLARSALVFLLGWARCRNASDGSCCGG